MSMYQARLRSLRSLDTALSISFRMRYPECIPQCLSVCVSVCLYALYMVYLCIYHGVLLVTHTVHVLQDVLMFVPHNRRLRFDWVIPIGGPLSEVQVSG